MIFERGRVVVGVLLPLLLIGCKDSVCRDSPIYGTEHQATASGHVAFTRGDVERRFDATEHPAAFAVVAETGSVNILDEKTRGRRARIHLRVPSEVETHQLEDLGAELWSCESDQAHIEPIATNDGHVEPACFEAQKDSTPAVRERLRGTLLLHEPPGLPEFREGESGFAFRYTLRVEAHEGSRTDIALKVSSSETTLITSCTEDRY